MCETLSHSFLLLNPGSAQVGQSPLKVLTRAFYLPGAGVSANSFLCPAHVMSHVPVNLSSYDI